MIPPTWRPSPNFKTQPHRRVDAVVLHATAGNFDGDLAWCLDPASKVSYHYLINKAGLVVQLVKEDNRAWHAGMSRWNGRWDLNSWSVGVGLSNLNDGKDPYSIPQIVAAVELIRQICSRYALLQDQVLGHYEVSGPDVRPQHPKTDPLGLSMELFRKLL